MANELDGRGVAILAADGVERVELEQPRDAVQNAGDASVHDYDALLLPGGSEQDQTAAEAAAGAF